MEKEFKEVAGGVPAVGSLSALVQLGNSSEESVGLQLRVVKMGIAANACSLVHGLHKAAESSMGLMSKLDAAYQEQLEAELPTMNREACAEEYERLMDRMMKLANLEVKMAQGRDLFPDDVISQEDKRILHLVHVIEESGRKDELLHTLEERFGAGQSFEPDVLEPEAPNYDDGSYAGVPTEDAGVVPYVEDEVAPDPKPENVAPKAKKGQPKKVLSGGGPEDVGVVPPPAVDSFAGAAFDDEFDNM